MSSTSSKATVDNPLYAQLKALYAHLQGDAATLSNALQAADRQMAAGQTWVGPAARSWGSELNGHSRDCATQVRNMLSEVEAAIARTPAKVPPQEAQSIAKLTAMAAQMGG
ncbi:MAG TPA: hypothetical protein VHF26_08070 [Trebonia sp.]|nr:hypothetical protein [Trebonia sp.]